MTSSALDRLRTHLKCPDHPVPHEATCTRSGYTLTLRETFDDEDSLVHLHLQLTTPSWPHAFTPLRPPQPPIAPEPVRFGPHVEFSIEDRIKGLDHASQVYQRLLGINRITTGDADFDRAFAASATQHPELLARTLHHTRARASIRALLGAGFHDVHIGGPGGVIVADYPTLGIPPSQDPRRPEHFDTLADHLVALADHLPPLQHDPDLDSGNLYLDPSTTAPPKDTKPAAAALFIGAIGAGLASGQLSDAPVFANLSVGIIGGALGLLIGIAVTAWRTHRHRDKPYWRHTAIVTALLACGALTPAMSALANGLNSAYAAPAQTVPARVTHTTACPDEAPKTERVCPITIQAPDISPDPITFTLAPSDHAQVTAGAPLQITYRVGMFGAPFLTAIDHP